MNIDMQNAFIAGLASGGVIEQGGGAELNIAFGDTAPADTSKLWIKVPRAQSVTVDYNPDNTVETVTTLSTMMPNDYYGAFNNAGAVNNAAYIFSDRVYKYDAEAGTISNLHSVTYANPACAVVGAKCYLFGGARDAYSNAISVYDTETNTLNTLSPTLPATLTQLAVGVVGTKVYVFGGISSGVFYNTICVYDTAANTLTTLPVTLPTAACAIGVGVVGTKFYLFGGQTSNGAVDTINVFDTETNTLTTLTTTLPSVRYSMGVCSFGTKCYLLSGGGSGSSITNTIDVFDANTETVETLTATLPQGVGSFGMGVVGASCYIFGGWNGSSYSKTINKFTITFPLTEGAIFVQEDMLRNQFTLVNAPTKVTVGVAAGYVGNASNEAEYADALLYDGAAWQPIT